MARDYVSLAEFAKETGMSKQFIWKKLISKEIKATMIGKTYIISYSEVRRVRNGRIASLEKEVKYLKEMERAAK